MKCIKYNKYFLPRAKRIKPMNGKNLKLIAVSDENYFLLKSLGEMGDSFTKVLDKVLAPYKENGVMMKPI